MFNDKLHIFTYKNTIDQSQLKLLAIFGQSRFSSSVRFSDRRHFHQQTDSVRAQFIIQRRSYIDWLELEQHTHKLLANMFSPKYFVKTTFRCLWLFLYIWIFTHISSSLEEKFRSKKSDKIVDTVTLKERASQLSNCYYSIHCNFLFVNN
jgi:hypothetical protein